MPNRWLFALSLIVSMLLAAACESVPTSQPGAANAPVESPKRQVVRILDLNVSLQPAAAPAATQAPPTIAPAPSDTPTKVEPAASPAITESAAIVPAATVTATTPACTNKAELVRHLSVAENTALRPLIFFAKGWQIRNVGTCTWTSDYTLVFISGEQMGAPSSIALPNPVQPGETVDISVLMMSPAVSASYFGNWMLRDQAGNLFGIGDQANQPLVVSILVSPTGAPKEGDVMTKSDGGG